MPKRGTWLSWCKKQWTGVGDPHSEVHPDHNTERSKDPDEVDSRPDKTCVDGHDRAAKKKGKEQLECPHVLHNIKYGSEDLLGLKTTVSAVKRYKRGESTNSGSFGGLRSFSINYIRGSSKESEHDSVGEG